MLERVLFFRKILSWKISKNCLHHDALSTSFPSLGKPESKKDHTCIMKQGSAASRSMSSDCSSLRNCVSMSLNPNLCALLRCKAYYLSCDCICVAVLMPWYPSGHCSFPQPVGLGAGSAGFAAEHAAWLDVLSCIFSKEGSAFSNPMQSKLILIQHRWPAEETTLCFWSNSKVCHAFGTHCPSSWLRREAIFFLIALNSAKHPRGRRVLWLRQRAVIQDSWVQLLSLLSAFS